MNNIIISFFFFFQAEDGIRDYKVTGVQTVLFRSEAVDEHAIEARAEVRSGRDVRHQELPPVAPPRVGDVARVDVHAHIVGVAEMAGVRSRPAAHIEHAPHRPQVVVREQRRELLVGEGRLPQAVGQRVLQGGLAEVHSRHLTCSQFASSVWGNRLTSASTRSLGGAPENGGRRLNTTTCTSCRSMAASTRAVRPAGSSKKSNSVRVGLRFAARKYTSGQSGPAQMESPWACARTAGAAPWYMGLSIAPTPPPPRASPSRPAWRA